MRVKLLTIKNVGIIANTTIPLDKPLILFYGDIRQGKSTILKAIQWLLGGDWPSDIIRHGENEASVDLEFDGGIISRSWYRGKDKDKTVTKARDVQFIRGGRPVPRPMSEIARMLNPFQLNQNYLIEKGEVDRKRYFSELFAIDTTDLDSEWVKNDTEAKKLRIEIGSYGDIRLTTVEPVDVSALQEQLAILRTDHQGKVTLHAEEVERLRTKHQRECDAVDQENRAAITRRETRSRGNDTITELTQQITETRSEIERLQAKLRDQEAKLSSTHQWLTDHPELPEKAKPSLALPEPPTAPNTAALEQKLTDAGAQNVRAEQYQKDKNRWEEKLAKEEKLRGLEKRQREIKAEKVAKLSKVSEASGIKGLSFNEDGDFSYEGTEAGMLSTSQLMQLSMELSAMYPEGLGLELLDRGESLGRSIFGFVQRALDENKTILATIVGEKPAKVPGQIGVFVVDKGNVQTADNDEVGIIP